MLRSGSHRLPTAGAALVATFLGGCGSASPASPSAASSTITIAINIPVSADPYVAGVIRRGADLGAKEANQNGLTIGGKHSTLALKIYDDNGQPQQSAQNVQSAISDGAVAVIEDGLGAAVSASKSAAAGVPEIDITNGTAPLMDPQLRPALFRLGIANDAAAGVLAKYIANTTQHVAIIHDDSDYGRDGADQLAQALATATAAADQSIEVPGSAATFDTQLQAASAPGIGAIAVWGSDVFIAKVVTAAHASGIKLPLFAGPTGESPAVRAAAGAAATDGLRFVSSRLTTEADSASFGQFEHRLAAAEGGPTDAGIKDSAGQEIRQPNDPEVFSYDAVNLVVAALQKQKSAPPGPSLISAIGSVNVKSANGDTRGFNPQNHEGVADDDMYIAVIRDMKYAPVQDEQLSRTLPTEDQILANFH